MQLNLRTLKWNCTICRPERGDSALQLEWMPTLAAEVHEPVYCWRDGSCSPKTYEH